jgi:transcriptional regulator with XRE-family HTH domain
MKERLFEFLNKENKTAAQLAEEIGVQPSGISHILSGRNKPSLDFVLKMLEKYPYISTEWLLFGKGGMYKESSMQELFNEADYETITDTDAGKQNLKEIKESIEDNNSKNIELTKKRSTPGIEKIIWFYSDNSFREFMPEED